MVLYLLFIFYLGHSRKYPLLAFSDWLLFRKSGILLITFSTIFLTLLPTCEVYLSVALKLQSWLSSMHVLISPLPFRTKHFSWRNNVTVCGKQFLLHVSVNNEKQYITSSFRTRFVSVSWTDQQTYSNNIHVPVQLISITFYGYGSYTLTFCYFS